MSKIFPFTVGGAGWPLTKIFPFTVGGGGAALDNNLFSGLNMYQAKSGVKNFSLYCGGGARGRGRAALDKKFFPGLNMYQAKSGVKKFSLY